MNYYTMRDDVASIKTNCAANIVKMTEMNLLIGKKFAKRTFHPLMQFLKNDVFDDFIGCLIV